MARIQKPIVRYGQLDTIEKSYPVKEFYKENSEQINDIKNRDLRNSILNALVLLASYDSCVPDIEIDFGELEDDLKDIDFGDLEDELEDIDFGDLEDIDFDEDFKDQESEPEFDLSDDEYTVALGKIISGDFDEEPSLKKYKIGSKIQLQKLKDLPKEELIALANNLQNPNPDKPSPKEKKKKYSRKDRPSPSVSATQYPVGISKIGNDDNLYEVVANKNGVKRWKKVTGKPKKTVPLKSETPKPKPKAKPKALAEQIKTDLESFSPGYVDSGDKLPVKIDVYDRKGNKHYTIEVGFRFLGEWIDDEEDDQEDYEDNDQRIWTSESWSHYSDMFKDWAKDYKWYSKVNVSVSPSEKDWAYFTVRIKK